MADVTLTYKGSTIAELSASGSKTINTAGKYCEADIGLTYVKPSGGGGTDLAAADVYVGDYLSATDLTVTLGAVDRYQRYIVGA